MNDGRGYLRVTLHERIGLYGCLILSSMAGYGLDLLPILQRSRPDLISCRS